jgi:hypothetical protein
MPCTEFTVNPDTYYPLAMTIGRRIRCRCGFGIYDAKIYVWKPDRFNPWDFNFHCDACAPEGVW